MGKIREAIHENIRWIPGFRSTVKCWKDNWLGYILADKVGIPLQNQSDYDQCISEYHSDEGWVLDSHFAAKFPNICADIIEVKIAKATVDTPIWTCHKSGKVTSKAAYKICRKSFPEINWGKWIWASFIPPMRSTFM